MFALKKIMKNIQKTTTNYKKASLFFNSTNKKLNNITKKNLKYKKK